MRLIFIFLVFVVFNVEAQKVTISGENIKDVLIDDRDNKKYGTVVISGTQWMTENLDYLTELSMPSDPQASVNPQINGRYYHIEETCCVCPTGWRLPEVEDWLSYFTYMLKSVDSLAPLKFLGLEDHFAIDGYSEKLDLFGDKNPLRLSPTGRVEGGKYITPGSFADYWTSDPPEWNHKLPETNKDHTHTLAIVYEGKTHIHIRKNSFTNIHSHEHHLNTKREKKLRMFMVRCVKSVE